MSSVSERLVNLSSEGRRARPGPLPQKEMRGPKLVPLSIAQERIWFLDQLKPGSPMHDIPTAVRLTGPLDVTALQQSLDVIIQRHASLRTTFATRDGRPAQVVAPSLALALPVVDLREFPTLGREAQVHRLTMEEAQWSFDLARGPLAHATLLRLGEEEHVFLLNVHSIVCDDWSLGILWEELATIYQALSTGEPLSLPEPPIQYADFAVWQREWLQGEVLEASLAYWKQQLGGALPVLELPTDRPRPPVQTYQGVVLSIALSKTLGRTLRELSRREGCALFVTLLAAFKTLLYRYTGQTDVIVGSPIATRNRRELEGLIGPLTNTLVLRTDLSGVPSFQELLRRVHEMTLGAYAHQDLPFARLVEELQPERDLSRTPLFQVLFDMPNPPPWETGLPGLVVENLSSPEARSVFDLVLCVEERGKEIQLKWVFNADLFAQDRMVEMLEQFRHLLWQIVENPGENLARFSLVTPTAGNVLPDPTLALCSGWQGAVHTLVSRQARQVPGQLAIVDRRETWTYKELDVRSNQLANYLCDGGIEPQDVVAIYGHRSASLVWAVMGVLKAGAAFVILDPAYPAAHLVGCLHRAEPRGWLQVEAAGTLPTALEEFVATWPFRRRLGLPHGTVAAAQGVLEDYSADDPGMAVGPDDLAYLAFTSGSAGIPKGILGRHGPLSYFLPWQRETFGLQGSDRYSMLSGLSHDPLQRDIFTPLALGATLYIPDPEQIGTPGWLAKWMRQEGISIAHLTPAMMQILTQPVAGGDGSVGEIPSLRYAFTVGDVLTKQDVSRLHKLAPEVTCVNLYGATETQRAVGCFVIPRDEGMGLREVIPLGQGIQDVQLLVLNTCEELAGIGELGEIYVRSPYLARGYLGDDTLTQERFVVNPFTGTPGDRLYRTGDLGRYLPDGNVEFQGRADQQVKIRGFRVEMGEIEAVLGRHPAVQETAVVARGSTPDDRRLIAFVVPREERAPSIGDLRRFLQEKLPTYMVPSAFVTLEALPLTPNGKVNRRALPEPGCARPELEESFVVSRSPVEEVLVGIWTQVLGVEQVGVRDNFFELGGHSLLATQVVSRVRDAFQVEFPLRRLFRDPTVAGLAAGIEAARSTEEGLQTPPIAPVSRDGPVALSFAQERLWFLDQWEPGTPVYNLPLALNLTGWLDMAALEDSLNEIVRRHESLRTNFIATGGQPLQVITPTLTLTLPMVDLGELAEVEQVEEVQHLAIEEARRSFDLARDLLLRATLLRLAQEEHVLLLNVHHITFDRWSTGVFFRELAALYKAFSTGRPSPLTDLPIQYADFAVWQRQWLQGKALKAQLSYWTERLGDAPALLELPTNRPRPAVQTSVGAAEDFRIDEELVSKLRALGWREGASLYMTVLAAFQTLLHRYTGQEDIGIGTYVAGRNRAEIEQAIGFFVNTLVMRTELSGNPSFRELLHRVREVTLGAYAHQDLPFERLLEGLQLGRNPSHTPLFQVMLALQNTPEHVIELPRLTVRSLDVKWDVTAHFDLTLWLWEVDGGLVGSLEYNVDLFDATTIVRMLGHFQVLLESIVVNPEQRLSDLVLLTEAERRQLLAGWNDTKAPYPRDICIHKLFEAQVEQTPDAVAVVFGDRYLTYQELNRQANQLAHYLQRLGVGPEVLVGVCVERSLEMVVGLLGILKAGGAYVPLDPTYPKERLAFMLTDTQSPVLLTQSQLLPTVPSLQSDPPGVTPISRTVCLDTDWEDIACESKENPVSGVAAKNLAYVVYTSGSTGKSKGVMIQHRSLLNYTQAASVEYALGPGDRALQFASISFDASAEEIYPCLIRGATLVLRTGSMIETVETFLLKCRDWEITVLNLPTAYWHEVVTRLSLEPLAFSPSIHLVVIGGERAIPARLTAWQRQIDQRVRLVNTYGPTEATIVATMCELSESVVADTVLREVSIGHPVRNVQTYVLDQYLRPVPVGVPGELYISGDGLGRGYLDRPRVTAERFIPNPFPPPHGGEEGARLYKTGDLARYLPGGSLEFIGRTDHQVKVRGFRVELGEIETVLGQHPAVRETVVVALPIPQAGASDVKQLVAYVIPHQEPPHVGELRHFLKEKLPDYMVPSAFVMLEALPLTASGKVDRRALPAPDGTRPELEAAFVPPRTPVEEILTGIWAQVLGLERCGVHDNFFELGGHSLLATRVISRMRQALQLELPLRSLFKDPTVAGLAARIETLRDAGVELQAPPIVPVPHDQAVPLSFAQRRLWFLDQLDPDNAAYNIPVALHLTGQLDVAALEQSINGVIERHQALRTTFGAVNGQPVQVIALALKLTLSVVDLGELAEVEREAQSRQIATEDARRPFDLVCGPLVRTILLRLGGEEHVLLLNAHHIVFDGWSLGVFVQEMGALYRSLLAGEPSPLPRLPIQYADFAVWQRRWPQGEVLETQLSYWKQQLGGDLPVLELPTDRPRPPVQTFRGATLSFELPDALTSALRALSLREGCTLFMTLLATFKALLYRYTGLADVVVGSPIANRNRTEIEGLIGFFVNTVVMRTDLSGDPTFQEVLRRVREVTLGVYAHQDLPFEMLVEELQPERYLSRTPLFQVMFVLHNAPMPDLELPGLALSASAVDGKTAKFDLTVSMWDTEQGLTGKLEYNTDLFDASSVTRLANHYQTLLAAVAANPERRLSDLPLLTEVERYQLLVEWNDTEVEYPQEQCVHNLFEAQVEQTPDAVAVVFKDRHVTYRELNRRANRLAHHLQALEVGPEALVGVCLERSVEMVMGLLGILKAGGAYVPLDPAYPEERLAFMLQDTQSSVLLTQERLVERLPEHGAKVVCVDTDWEALAQGSEVNPRDNTTGKNLAYVMYTSGSTGRPKGSRIVHQGVVRLVKETNYANLTAEEILLQFAPTSFDASTLEIWGSLLNGGRLVLFPPYKPSLEELGQVLQQQQVTMLWLTAGLFHLMVDERLEDLRYVRQLLAGGDVLSVPHIKRVLRELKGCRMINGYGPTENTTFTCCYSMTPDSWIGASVPIGQPIANTQVYVLDRSLQPVPVGVPGELCIGGDGLARDYLNRPDETAAVFLPSPFSKEPGARLYKTGDLVRYLLDGNIEFLGRIDHQVKIRGFRIELGEIEARLTQHPAVQEAIVLAREDKPGDKRLVAYVVSSNGKTPGVSELCHFLREKLPEYMVPSAFVTLEALPLTPNGKVDRRALPAPEVIRPELEETFVAPRTPTEEVLTGIWADILGIERIGIHDSFFELGGHSLLATQVVSRLRQVFQVELPLRALFEASTVADLAKRVDLAQQMEQGLSAPPIQPATRDGELPLSFAQQRLWFIDQWEPGNHFYNIPAAWRLSGPLDVAALEWSLNEIVRRHEALRTTLVTRDGQPIQIIAPALTVELPVVDLQDFSEAERESQVQRLATKEARRAFDLATGPVVRAKLLRLGVEEHVFLLTVHHIASDGWSMGLFIREVAALYQAFSAGQPSPLPGLPIQYADFAVWQREWLQNEVLETQLAYWKQQLGGDLSVLELPTDRPRPPARTWRGATRSFDLPDALTEALRALSQQEGVTFFMTLLAAFKILLHRYTGQTDVVVGIPIANRRRLEIEGLIGFFVNTLVMRTNLSGNPTFREVLGRVREVALGAYAHQDLPFEMLVEELQPQRNLSHAPLFQVMFVLQNAPLEALELPGLTLSWLEMEHSTAKFDLTLNLWEVEGELEGTFEYTTDLFDDDTIVRMMEHYQTLLAAVAANPERRLSDLPLLTEVERYQLLVEWNDTEVEYPQEQCIHNLFEAQVEQTPDAVAVVFEDQHLTYRELDRRASQLARHLQRLGVGPEVPVGLCTERSLEMVIGILGILKAGGAYVPLDPAYPGERLAFMLEDIQTPLLLTQRSLVDKLPEHGACVVCLDAGWEDVAIGSKEIFDRKVVADNLAYLIHTSGSTGRPKGVMVPQRALINHARALTGIYRLSPSDRMLQFVSSSFDASAEEIFPTLLNGATLVLPDDVAVLFGNHLLEFCERQSITILHLPAPVWHQCVDEAANGKPPMLTSLRISLVGGDNPAVDKLETWAHLVGPRIRFLNAYGPTETTITATLYGTACAAEAIADLSRVPIGRPIANAQVYILDAYLRPVPVGVLGELYIGGIGVARGYLNRPGLTARAFIPNPFPPSVPPARGGDERGDGGARLYRTGDLARYLPDGNIEFLGRVDHQVKVRGFRIEPGEIEIALARHEVVREALVVAGDDVTGGKQLIAYLVTDRGSTPSSGELRRFLQERLPDYMVPASFVVLDAFPLTASGKVDRRALPPPGRDHRERGSFFVAPSTPFEEILAEVWEEVLRLAKIGVHDNFFDLGGHSLLATQVLSRVRSRFEIDLPVRCLFEAPTIAEMALRVEQALIEEIEEVESL